MTTLNKPRITQLLDSSVPRYVQTGGALVAAFNTFDGAPAGDWIKYSDYEPYLEQLRLAVERIEELENMVIAAYNCGWDNGYSAQHKDSMK